MVLLDLAVERGPADAEQLGRFGHVVAGAVERFGDQPPFPVVDAQRFQVAAARIAEGQVVRPDRILVGQHDGAVEHVAELPHVARPAVGEQLGPGRVGQAQVGPAVQAAEMIEEEIDQQADVVAAVAQRRQVQLEHAEPVVQVLAEPLVADVLLQVLIRGGDHADVDAHFLRRPDRQKRMAFENPQQLGLAFERQLADFVEKQRAQVGLLEEADVVAIGAGERAGLVAEQLALHEVGRDGARN